MCDVKKAFENGKALIPFITCGDPDLETTAEVVRAAVQNGADLIELGIPFSDPTAESAVLMEADQRALAAGATTDKVFELVKELRQEITIPFVFMTYANVVFSYGTERFAQKCADVGVAGVILHDVPFEEKEEFAPICEKSGVDFISFVTPTYEDRLSMIASGAQGFLYVVSSSGSTKLSRIDRPCVDYKDHSRKTSIPCATGFGRPEAFTGARNGVIVGAAIVKYYRVRQRARP